MRYNSAYAATGISGDPTPSEADIKITRDLIRAGVIIGNGNFTSLRALGYFSV
jgi:DNA repair protein RadC